MLQDQKIDERYPIGKFKYESISDSTQRKKYIFEIESAPQKLKEAINGLTEKQLDTPYRKDGWTVRQVIHHLPDSHLNAYVRFKLALTENNPLVKTYDEKKWAELEDTIKTPVEVSINLFENLHARWVQLLNSLKEEDFKKTYKHPERGEVTLDWVIAQYAWHGKHHIAHITSLRERKGW